ncbi:hypothetical protein [Lishizhenia tianjinensis]|nr:hypothetical protein [Lishizhenia tianjinensis]
MKNADVRNKYYFSFRCLIEMKGIFAKQIVYPVLALVIGLVLVQMRVLGWDLSRIPGDLGDARFNMYLLEHAYQFSTGQWAEYWNAGFFYPAANAISFSDNLLGSSPIYIIGRWLGLSREGAFQFWIVILAILNFVCAYLFLKKVSKRADLSALGAYIFAFSIVLFSQMYHVQTMPRFPFPLMLMFAYMFHQKGERKYFVLTVWMLVWQFYCGVYLGFFALFILGVYILVNVFLHPAYYKAFYKEKANLLYILLHAALQGVAMAVLMYPYFLRSRGTEPYTLERILATVPRPASYFYSIEGTLLWKFLSDVGNGWEWSYTQTLFTGGVASLSIVALLVLWLIKKEVRKEFWSKRNRAFLITAILTFIFFIKIGDHSLYALIKGIPGFGALRSLDRMINLELLFIALAFVYIAKKYLFRKERFWMFALAMTILGVDNYKEDVGGMTIGKFESQERVNIVLAKMSDFSKEDILCYQPDTLTDNCIYYQLDAMQAAQEKGVKSVNGYSATSPYGFDMFWRELNDAGRRKWMEMSGADTTHVVVVH